MITADDKVYVSGPMTGRPYFNKLSFFRLDVTLRRVYGCEVLNPATMPDGLTWEEYMRLDLEMLRRATILYQLPGWEYSRGAVIEHDVALMGGLLVLPISPIRFGVWEGNTPGLKFDPTDTAARFAARGL